MAAIFYAFSQFFTLFRNFVRFFAIFSNYVLGRYITVQYKRQLTIGENDGYHCIIRAWLEKRDKNGQSEEISIQEIVNLGSKFTDSANLNHNNWDDFKLPACTMIKHLELPADSEFYDTKIPDPKCGKKNSFATFVVTCVPGKVGGLDGVFYAQSSKSKELLNELAQILYDVYA